MEHVSGILQDTVLVARRLAALACHGSMTLNRALVGKLHKAVKAPAVGVAAVVGAFFVVFGACLFVYISEQGDSSCPPQKQPAKPDGASALLALAYQGDARLGNKTILKKCMQWEPKQSASPSMEQLRAQLECHSAFIATITHTDDAVAERVSFVARAKGALGAIKGITQRCAALQNKLYTLNRAGAATRRPTEAIVALSGLAGFEQFARDALSTLTFLHSLREKGLVDASSFGDVSRQVPSLQVDLRVCILKAAREARVMVHALPVALPSVQRVEQCKPGLLAGLENLALAKVDLETDPSVNFAAGMLMSEVGMAPSTAPFYGNGGAVSSDWFADTKGFRVPAGIATSEKMLLGSLDALAEATNKAELAKSCLMRLAKHAKFLAGINQYAPAEWRYRASAELARSHASHEMTSSALAQLSYFLSLHGQYEEALKTSTDALGLSNDSLATYLQATLRLGLGELRSVDQVLGAADQLRAVAGKLPAEHLETSRKGVLAKLEELRGISDSEAGVFACLKLGDAAQLLSCVIGRLVYDA